MYRVEDKFACTELELFLLQHKLAAVLAQDHETVNPDGYQITSLYFDDYRDSALEDTRLGRQERSKYRIRIYNGSYDTIKLEVKKKRNSRILKYSRTITKEQMEKLAKGETIEDDNPSLENPITLFNMAISKDYLKPKVIVEYDRAAYIYEAGNVRITLDRNLRYSKNIDDFVNQNTDYCTAVKDTDSVLEVKYDEFLPSFIAGLLESGKMNQTSFSKYKICREEP